MTETVTETSADNLGDETQAAVRQTTKRVSVSVWSLITAALIAALVLSTAAMTWLYLGERATVRADQQRAADSSHAERIALDYAVNAAAMNYQKMPEWKEQLVRGTSPELHRKLTDAATSMEQLLVPLEWSSTSKPLAATVRSESNGMYVVDTFVSVLTKTTQAPNNLQSTATYSITVDSKADWQITDVGGIGNVLGNK